MTLISLFELDIEQYIDNFTDELYDLKHEIEISFGRLLGCDPFIEHELDYEVDLVI